MVKTLEAGATLCRGKYRIGKVLGQGSFGITYLASARFEAQGNLGRMNVEAQVAVKEFFMSEVNGRKADGSSVDGSSGSVFANYRKKFRREAENLARLDHPDIVKVLDIFDENNTTYYVMEFIEGQNLDDYIRRRGGVPEAEALALVGQVGAALSYMHSRQMLHLDIKPKNIMRRPDGTVCLVDFGLSKQFTAGGEPESSTTIGLGTPGYAPIEQARYRQDGTFPATLDVYALGATLFKLLTGQRPPDATDILNEGFPEKELARRVSPDTLRVLRKAMAPVRRDRYQNIPSFMADFKDEGTVVELEPQPEPQSYSEPAPAPRPPKPTAPGWWAKYKTICLSAGAALLLFGAVIVVSKNIGGGTPALNPEDSLATADSLAAPVEEVEEVAKEVTDMTWASPLGAATYSGEVMPDTVAGSTKLLPHGKGVARITGGKYAGCTYDGEFSLGRMEGHATYTLKDGDVFVGTFKNNQYSEGRYTMKSTGEYFVGSFKNTQPEKGTWYNRKGKKLE